MKTDKPPKKIEDIKRPAKLSDKNKGLRTPIKLDKRFFRVSSSSVLIVIVLFLIFIMIKPQQAQTSQQKLQSVINKVSKLYILPKNEEPVLATVTDRSKLSTPFLKQSQNGDKVLIYPKNRLVIVYRPSINKVVSVSPVLITPINGK